jgi:hypothetical protein
MLCFVHVVVKLICNWSGVNLVPLETFKDYRIDFDKLKLFFSKATDFTSLNAPFKPVAQ